jgi:membrane protein YqaA with SNARE-associated domain
VKTLKHLYERYSNAILHLLQPLGLFGVFAMAFVDSAAFGMPLDAMVGTYIWVARDEYLRVATVIFMAASGSALGSTVLYLIGKKGGEALLHSRMTQDRAARMEAWFERHEFLALMFPSMLPPPAPFKLFVISAAVFQMHYVKFLFSIFVGRAVRFLILAVLIIRFGPKVSSILSSLFHRHLGLSLAILGGGIVLLLIFFLRRKRRTAAAT